jgi:serine/threonine protein kinase/dienelactone hydrolase
MNRDRFAEIERVCQGALDLDPGERAAFLDEACGGDTNLREEVDALLAGASDAPSMPEVDAPRGVSAALAAGQRLGPYEIIRREGAGGMGEVYKARDTRLGRTIAIKVLPASMASDTERRARLVRESKTIAGLNHPRICALFDVGREVPSAPPPVRDDEHSGPSAPEPQAVDFLVLEYVEGKPLPTPCSVEQALDFAIQIAEALKASHEQGIIHRDLKPSNVMVTPAGQVKVLDFGLSRRIDVTADPGRRLNDSAAPTHDPTLTGQGVALGTPSYMSPEQVEGRPLDARTDIFSFGVLLYELLTGQRAFKGDSAISLLSAILRDTPAAIMDVRRDVPKRLAAVVARCLEKNRDARYASAADLLRDLRACQSDLPGHRTGLRSLLRPRVMVPLACVLVAMISAGGWLAYRASRARWARNVALPEIARLAVVPNARAFVLAREARRYLPDDPAMEDWWRAVALPGQIRTTPPGALVQRKDYAAPDDSPWETAGTTPLMPWTFRWFVVPARLVAQKLGLSSEPTIRPADAARVLMVPSGYVRWRISREGNDPIEVAFSLWTGPRAFELKAKGTTPVGMVRVPAGSYQYAGAPQIQLGEYLLDTYETTNRQFKEFVDAGGYRNREYWKQPFVKDSRELTWEQAMEEFRDTTGRPGPSTWSLGSYPDGQADFPVGGVSWYEAAAYAAFRGKTLPTVHHWRNAADFGLFSDIFPLSNFGTAPAPVGKFRGMGAWGTYDMAGNVKEWCANAEKGDRRYILGGGFGESGTMFEAADAQPAFSRVANFGIRCASYPHSLSADLLAPVGVQRRDYNTEKPVDDETFSAYRNMYAYDHTPLNAVVESVDDSRESWRKEKITFDAAYGKERVSAYLFLPRNAVPPYQLVVYYPSAVAIRLRSSENLATTPFFQWLTLTGRAVLQPVYKGHYDRKSGPLLDPVRSPNSIRDRIIQQYRDLARSIDYMETRPDIDATRLSYYGTSAGVTLGPVFMALEPRLKASILVAGGLPSTRYPPAGDAINFAPRAKMPTLLLGGAHDFVFPVETNQKPLIRLLGAPDQDKKYWVFVNSGHFPDPADLPDGARMMLEWLDKYLGPVKMKK